VPTLIATLGAVFEELPQTMAFPPLPLRHAPLLLCNRSSHVRSPPSVARHAALMSLPPVFCSERTRIALDKESSAPMGIT